MSNSSNKTSQMADMFKTFMDPEVYNNAMKNLPALDLSALSDTIGKTTKIIATTNKIAAESVQEMIKKNTESLQCHTMKMFNSMKDAVSSGDFKQIAECQQKCFKSAYETSLNNTKEFIAMASDVSSKMIEAINNMTDHVTQNEKHHTHHTTKHKN